MKYRIWILCVLLLSLTSSVFATSAHEDSLAFHKLFTNWTSAFNNKNLPASCDLFAESIHADYRGTPQRHYSDICDGFKKTFSDKNKNYQYSFKLHDVYRSGDLAAARITWYLQINENGKHVSTTQDEGMDVLKRNGAGQWKIVNYIAYED
jgi:ketosteroid isomerase-like protein